MIKKKRYIHICHTCLSRARNYLIVENGNNRIITQSLYPLISQIALNFLSIRKIFMYVKTILLHKAQNFFQKKERKEIALNFLSIRKIFMYVKIILLHKAQIKKRKKKKSSYSLLYIYIYNFKKLCDFIFFF